MLAVKKEFDSLVEEVFLDTRFSSRTQDTWKHPLLGKIVDMGDEAVPWLVEILDTRPLIAMAALEGITGDSPANDCRTPSSAVWAWQEWGKMRRDYQR